MGNGGEARQVQGPANQMPEGTHPQGPGPPNPTRKRKWTPQEVLPEYEGPRLTGGQELHRLFATSAQGCPILTQEDLPRLPQAKSGQGSQEAAGGAHQSRDLGTRP
eukprot:7767585-Heterocapsa_arctica.AAC.1